MHAAPAVAEAVPCQVAEAFAERCGAGILHWGVAEKRSAAVRLRVRLVVRHAPQNLVLPGERSSGHEHLVGAAEKRQIVNGQTGSLAVVDKAAVTVATYYVLRMFPAFVIARNACPHLGIEVVTAKEGFKGILSDAAVDHARAVVGLRPALKGLLKVFHHLVIERGSAFGLRRTAAEPVVVPGHHSTSPKVYDVVVGKSPEGFCLTHELVDLFLRNSRRAVATDGDAVLAQVAGHLDEIVAYGDVHVETAVDAVVDHIVVGLCALHKLGDTGILIHPHALVGSELVEHKESARVLRSASVYPLDVAVPVRPGLSGNGKPLIALRKDSTQSLARVFLEGRLHDGGRVVGKLVEVADA